MSSRSEVKKLEALLGRVHKLLNELHAAGEYELSKQAVEISRKLDQKIQGHRANLKRKK